VIPKLKAGLKAFDPRNWINAALSPVWRVLEKCPSFARAKELVVIYTTAILIAVGIGAVLVTVVVELVLFLIYVPRDLLYHVMTEIMSSSK